jgi:hypothetical protein
LSLETIKSILYIWDSQSLKETIKAIIMTELETHFQRSDVIDYEALSIALEKAKITIQEKDKEIESLKEYIYTIKLIVNAIDLSPATKEENGMNTFKKNKE